VLDTRIENIRKQVSQALMRNLPVERDDAWIEKLVDRPRFGWDWEALEKGFFQPLQKWSERHSAHLRPILASLLIDALGQSSARHANLLAALELQYLSSIMLDDLRNGRDLSEATSTFVTVPLPTWVTIAYNVRQLSPVMIARQSSELSATSHSWLVNRFSRLFQPGLSSALDLWGCEQESEHSSEAEFLEHLRLYVGGLFGLACDVASAVAERDERAANSLRTAGIELGVALRLSAMAQGSSRSLCARHAVSVEQLIRWQRGVDPARLLSLAQQTMDRALSMAHVAGPAATDAFRIFSSIFEYQACEEKQP
jgi:hypothetical protein